MTTLIGIFVLSMLTSMLLTPAAIGIANRYGLVDIPAERSVHSAPLPRIGGVAIYIGFFLPFICIHYYPTLMVEWIEPDRQMICLVTGATLAFFIGLADDIRRLSPWIKFGFQIIAAGVAYYGGIRINGIIFYEGFGFGFGLFSLPVTLLWFLTMINAINLIDGLDGLAAGIILFSSIVLLVFCVTGGKLLTAMGFAALGGASMGFLRYNFNPASVFMGDSGSYFLGYMMAALGIVGTMKTHAAAAMLIPVIALGVPLFDTVLSPIRRFIRGRRIFGPDRAHLHHRLIRLGITHRNAVLILYGITIGMGILSIVMVNLRDEKSALIFVILGISVIMGIRKLGYFEYLAADKVFGWIRDMTDEAGISRDRRSFLSLQIEIGQSRDMEILWDNMCLAFDRLRFDMAEISFADGILLCCNGKKRHRIWTRNGFNVTVDICKDCLLKLELPLLDRDKQNIGTLWLVKDLSEDAIGHYTLRRVEHLRRTVMETLRTLERRAGK